MVYVLLPTLCQDTADYKIPSHTAHIQPMVKQEMILFLTHPTQIPHQMDTKAN